NIWDVKLYPNPAVNELTFGVDHHLVGDYQWKIVDQRGVEVLSGELNFENGTYTTDVTSIPNGVYYVVIGVEGKPMMYKKVVIANK
ncbi:MAG: T9SS type A sorting domain-containing protein, partial [Cyclobacteriaceae bacterium]|nr:T9SS type A sorting domain-containing protein [Cyclobacteriaceae bacterium]